MNFWPVYAANAGVIVLALSIFIGYLRWERADVRRLDNRYSFYQQQKIEPPERR